MDQTDEFAASLLIVRQVARNCELATDSTICRQFMTNGIKFAQ